MLVGSAVGDRDRIALRSLGVDEQHMEVEGRHMEDGKEPRVPGDVDIAMHRGSQ